MQRFVLIQKIINSTNLKFVKERSIYSNIARSLHGSKYLSKKLGYYSDVTLEQGDTNKKVKLYPGFQISHEEIRQKVELGQTSSG